MDPTIGQVNAFGFSFAPRGWALCQGQELSISSYSTLFSLIGTTFGGNGVTTFAVPDLRSRTIIGVGAPSGLPHILWGEMGGAEKLTLTYANMPVHNHLISNGNGTSGTTKVTTTISTISSGDNSNVSDNGANGLGTGGTLQPIYREVATSSDYIGGAASTINGTTSAIGGSLAFGIRNPYLGMNYCIALEGVFPSRN